MTLFACEPPNELMLDLNYLIVVSNRMNGKPLFAVCNNPIIKVAVLYPSSLEVIMIITSLNHVKHFTGP